MAEEEEVQEKLQVSKKQAVQLAGPGGAGPASKIEQRTSTQVLVEHNAKGAEVTVKGPKAKVAKAMTMLKVLVAFKEAASPEERGLCHWFACGFCRDGRDDEDGCEAGLHSSKIIAETQAAWLAKAPKNEAISKVNARPLLLVVSCGGAGPPVLPSTPGAPGLVGPRPQAGGGIGCPEEDLLELCMVAVDWEAGGEVSRFHRFIRPTMWDQQDAHMREANPAACFSDKPAAVHFTDALADLLDWLPRLLGVSMDEMRTEDILFVSPRDFEVQSLLPRRCSLNGAVDYGLQDFFFRRWCCLKDVFREHFALPNEAAPNGLNAMARYLGLPPSDKTRRTFCLDENVSVVRVVLELLKKGWKPKATAWRHAVGASTTFLLPRRGDLPDMEQNSRKRGFWEVEAPPPAPIIPKLPPTAKIIGATAKVAPKPIPPWQRAGLPVPPPPEPEPAMAEAQAEQTQELEQPEPVEQTELEAAPFMAEPVEPVESVGLEAMDFLAEISAELPAGTTFEAVD
ncbi:unnamed protein product [Durusdinium trenchii]|uniref:Uncharacterized protein n=1 Tax=Durusdinium trenchii TaxID=1381693 RepID=A0ABP0JDB0_9DINO